jgi:hypothetical protein
LRIERDSLAFGKSAQAGSINSGNMHEYIIPAAFWLNEAKTFATIKQLDFANGHLNLLG